MNRNRKFGVILFTAFWVVLLAVTIFLIQSRMTNTIAKKRPKQEDPVPQQNNAKTRVKSRLASNKIKAEDPMKSDQRQFLWQVEHHGNVLSQHGFKQLQLAIKEGNQKLLLASLAAEFRGEFPTDKHELVIDAKFARARRRSLNSTNQASSSRSGFVAELLKYRSEFQRPPNVKFSLRNLRPRKRADLKGPWIGTCLVRMWQEIEPGKPGEVAMEWEYEVVQPTEEAIAKGKWILRCTILQAQVSRSEKFLMKEVAAERGIKTGFLNDNWTSEKELDGSAGVYLCDYNRDGMLDMLISGESFRLYRGIPGGKFRNATAETQLLQQAQTGSVAPVGFADLDGDGWEDLIYGNQIFRNVAGKQFEEVTSRSNLKVPNGASNVVFADYDRDGRVDLYFAVVGFGNAHSWLNGTSANESTNALWRNTGNWLFEDVTEKTDTAAGARSTFSAVWLHANDDRWPDIYVINEFGNGVLLVNQRGKKFENRMIVRGPSDFGSMGVTCGDVNNDGQIDIYEASMYSKAGTRVIANVAPGTYSSEVMKVLRTFVSGSQLHLNHGAKGFTHEGPKYQVAAVGWAYGPALVDLDNDGWLDLHATCGHMSRDRQKPDG